MSSNPVDAADPAASPDFLAGPPKRGAGVRRVNKLPLVIFGGLVVLVVITVTYTMQQRQQAAQRAAVENTTLPEVAESAAAPVRATKETGTADGFITPEDPYAMPMRPADPESVQGGAAPVALAPPARPSDPLPQGMPSDGTGTTQAAPTVEDQRVTAAREERRQIIARVQQAKMQDFTAALDGPSSIESFGAKSGQGGAMPTDAPGGVASADAGTAEAMERLAAMSGLGANAPADPNRQADKLKFLTTDSVVDNYLTKTREPAISRFEVKAGAVIPAVMISGLNSDLPGQVIAQVRENVYDSATGRFLLIPQGARIIGKYDNGVTFGQRRALTAWPRIIFPDGSSLNLGNMPGADLSGYAGFKDQVNNHYLRTYGSAILLSVFAAGVQLSQPPAPENGSEYDPQQVLASELGRQLGQLGMESARRNLDVAPTLEVRPGYKFNIMVTKDMVLPPYVDGQ